MPELQPCNEHPNTARTKRVDCNLPSACSTECVDATDSGQGHILLNQRPQRHAAQLLHQDGLGGQIAQLSQLPYTTP